MTRFTLLAALAFASLVACSSPPAAAQSDRTRVNGSIEVAAGETAGDVTTVNGSITVGASGRIQSAQTVNGSVTLGDGAVADELQTVNGAVRVGSGAEIKDGVATVNGAIEIGPKTTVGGTVGNVSGRIELKGATVRGRLTTVRGDIELAAGARVDGDLVVEKSKGGNYWGSDDKPRIVIGPGCVVVGKLRFERPVDLYVSDRAQTGAIVGATATKFAGDAPTP